jgi:hypothetical protein
MATATGKPVVDVGPDIERGIGNGPGRVTLP